MSDHCQPSDPPWLSLTLEKCLSQLDALALNLDTYGTAEDAEQLHEVIDELKRASQTTLRPLAGPMDFVVNGTFKVGRQQVANTLWHAFTGEITWFTIRETVPPRTVRFRSIDQTNPGIVDYPLNDGGAVRVVSTGAKPDPFELRLDVIARGLDVLATRYPRHFADLVNENGDSITADVLLQCCFFGELLYT